MIVVFLIKKYLYVYSSLLLITTFSPSFVQSADLLLARGFRGGEEVRVGDHRRAPEGELRRTTPREEMRRAPEGELRRTTPREEMRRAPEEKLRRTTPREERRRGAAAGALYEQNKNENEVDEEADYIPPPVDDGWGDDNWDDDNGDQGQSPDQGEG